MPRSFSTGTRSQKRQAKWILSPLFWLTAIGIIVGLLSGITRGPTSWTIVPDLDNCPTADSVKTTIVASIGVEDRTLTPSLTATIEAQGIEPESAPLGSLDLSATSRLAACLIPGTHSVNDVSWREGNAKFVLTLPVYQFFSSRNDSVSNSPATFDLNYASQTYWIDLCPAPDESLVCSTKDSRGTISLKTSNIGADGSAPESVSVSPYPSSASVEGLEHSYEWQFTGIPPRISAEIPLPILVTAQTLMVHLPTVQIWHENVSLGYSKSIDLSINHLGSALSAYVALAVGAFVFRRVRRRLPALILSIALIVLVGIYIEPNSIYIGVQAAVMALCWTVIIVGLSKNPKRAVLAVLPALLLCQTGYLIASNRAASQTTTASGELLTITIIGVSLACLMVAGMVNAFRVAMEPLRSIQSASHWLPGCVQALTVTAAWALAYWISFPIGSALGSQDQPPTFAEDLLREIELSGRAAGYALISALPLIVVGLGLNSIANSNHNSDPPWSYTLGPSVPALLIALATPAGSRIDTFFIVSWPTWILSMVAIQLGFRSWLRRAPKPYCDIRNAELLRQALENRPEVGGGEVHRPETRRRALMVFRQRTIYLVSESRVKGQANYTDQPRDPAGVLFSRGPATSWMGNAYKATALGAVLAILPVAYFTWTVIGSISDNLTWSEGPLIAFISVLTESVRWLVLAFVFGALYFYLPGRIGPYKAASFGGLWVVGSLTAAIITRSFGGDVSGSLVYRSAQVLLFTMLLAVAFDLSTLQASGGTWRQLRDLYQLGSHAEIVARLAPIALVVITLAQQLSTGSGLDVAESFVSGIQGILK